MNTAILTYADIRKIRDGDSTEKLVNVRSYDDSIIAQYEKMDMVAYVGFDILVRKTVAQKLAKVNQRLRDRGFMLKIVYGFRALEVQTNYFNKRRAELAATNIGVSPDALTTLTHNFVAVPDVAGHATGGAVDVTLVDNDGVDCDMGTKIADYSNEDRIKTFAGGLTVDQKQRRELLFRAMMAEGFAPFFGEWWHFSYGDKEWAAYYQKSRALYGPVVKEKTATLLRIAGGNETVLQSIKGRIRGVTMAGSALMAAYPTAEQSGLLFLDDKRLEMAGDEFCGNASAAAAVLLSRELSKSKVKYSVSGFEGGVVAKVVLVQPDKYRVYTTFAGMKYAVDNFEHNGKRVAVVDMKGIVHILVDGEFPASNYELAHQELVDRLNLRHREAVGVVWYKQQAENVVINPVVWVKEVNTLYYESACGSGAIAAALVTGYSRIIQPTGECIAVRADGSGISTDCEVTIVAAS